MMSHYDWSRFLLRVNINTEPQKIYDAWTTQAGLESWFLRQAEFTRTDGVLRAKTEHFGKGDAYEWRWYGYHDDVVERRKVLEVNGCDLLSFAFSGDCIVTVRVTEEAGESLCILEQSGIQPDEQSRIHYYHGCSLGWTFYLANLKSILEGGLDLRNKNLRLPNVINA